MYAYLYFLLYNGLYNIQDIISQLFSFADDIHIIYPVLILVFLIIDIFYIMLFQQVAIIVYFVFDIVRRVDVVVRQFRLFQYLVHLIQRFRHQFENLVYVVVLFVGKDRLPFIPVFDGTSQIVTGVGNTFYFRYGT